MTRICEQTARQLNDSLSGELSARDALQMERHLAICAHCRRIQAGLHRTLEIARSLPPVSAPDGFAEAVRARIAAMPPASRQSGIGATLRALVRRRHLPYALAAGACVVVLAGRLHPTQHIAARPAAVPVQPADLDSGFQGVALTVSDPLGDVSAANLVAHTPAAEVGQGR